MIPEQRMNNLFQIRKDLFDSLIDYEASIKAMKMPKDQEKNLVDGLCKYEDELERLTKENLQLKENIKNLEAKLAFFIPKEIKNLSPKEKNDSYTTVQSSAIKGYDN